MSVSISEKIRRDIEKIAERHKGGETMKAIAKDYKCSGKLIERTMKQLLPVEYFVELKRKEILAEKKKLSGGSKRGV